MGMTADMYIKVIDDARELIQKCRCYIDGRTPDGLKEPFVFYDKIELMIHDLAVQEGELNVYIKGLYRLKEKPKYEQILEETRVCYEELVRLRDDKFFNKE